jgi:RNA polymerase sigma-70 factor (ECF subfamily)
MCDIDAVIDMPTENHHDLSDVRMDVESCLRALTDAERTVVLLFYMEDQPINKISAIMGMPNGTVKSHLARARKKMASVMLRKRLRE